MNYSRLLNILLTINHRDETAEFYQTFFNVIGKDLVEIINDGFKRGELSLSMRRGVIVLIWKGDDTRIYKKTWRHISLLNYDYKAITKVSATRVRDNLPKIIDPNKKCGTKGSPINDGAALIRDLIEYVNRKYLPGILIYLDQTKAYDRVEWDFLFKVLRKFNFGQTQGFLMGKLRYAKDIRWTYDKILILGFCFGNVDVSKDKWETTIAKIKSLLNIWCKRKLTFYGKVTVINSLATSGIWSLSILISLP